MFGLKISLGFVLLLLLSGCSQAFPLNSCPGTSSIFDLETFTFSPDPPVGGSDLQVRASGLLKAPITQGAKVRVELKYRFATVYDKTDDFCAATEGSQLECPIEPGQLGDLKALIPIPAAAPKLNYSVKITFTNGDGSLISCLSGPVKFT